MTLKIAETIEVAGKFVGDSNISNRRNLGFLRSVNGDPELVKRISAVRLFDGNGGLVETRNLIDGEYLTASDHSAFAYIVNANIPANPIAAAHRSWTNPNTGVLMLDDLLPQFGTREDSVSAKVTLELPEGWRAFWSGGEITGPVIVDNVREAVIFAGSSLRFHAGTADRPPVITTGEWKFPDEEILEQTREVYGEYIKLFGAKPKGFPAVALFEMPGESSAGIWAAETRGSTVTIVSKDMPFRTQSVQRLHEQLRHEVFHLWMPNSLNLIGDYAWFYEGFALYRSLRLAVEVNRIRFDDLLDTLSRAYAIDARRSPRRPLAGSLGTNSPADTQTYARGMIIAFLADIHLLSASRARQDTASLLRAIFVKHGPGSETTDAASTLLKILPADVADHVTSANPIDWTAIVLAAGLRADPDRGGALSVVPKLNGKQKAILDRLGYNNWRRAPRRSK